MGRERGMKLIQGRAELEKEDKEKAVTVGRSKGCNRKGRTELGI